MARMEWPAWYCGTTMAGVALSQRLVGFAGDASGRAFGEGLGLLAGQPVTGGQVGPGVAGVVAGHQLRNQLAAFVLGHQVGSGAAWLVRPGVMVVAMGRYGAGDARLRPRLGGARCGNWTRPGPDA